jgi:predicted phage terminase large subunit-like protein
MTPYEIADVWMQARQRARTDLLWLCNEIMGYKDVQEVPHGTLIRAMQQFPGGQDVCDRKTGQWLGYVPSCGIWDLQGPRRRLFLWPRGHLKTSIITIAHTLQWVINFPDIRILISTAVADQAQSMLKSIKSHFQFTPEFRALFPEFCPEARSAGEFGNQEEFTVPNRVQKHLKEPTVSVTAIGKVIAGYHYEIIKDSDLVDKENIKTEGGRRNTIEHFKYMWPLVERNKGQYGWRDTEGTRYDFSDTYGTEIIEKEEKLPESKRTWHQEIKSCYPEEGGVLWPSRWTKALLEDEENSMGPTLFAAQYLNQPVPDSGGLCGPRDIVFFPRKNLSGIPLRLHCTIDLHGGEENVGNDYTVLNVSGFDNDGRMYLVDLRVGHFTPFETIEHIFAIHKKHNGIDFKIEKDAHARILLPFLKREMQKRGTWPLMVPIKRDSRISKKQRIMGLQAWFRAGNIRILEDISSRMEIIQQITRFSLTSHYHDDILDTMADHMQNSDGGVHSDIYPRNRPPVQFEHFVDKFMGFGPDGDQIWYLDPPPNVSGSKWPGTGL